MRFFVYREEYTIFVRCLGIAFFYTGECRTFNYVDADPWGDLPESGWQRAAKECTYKDLNRPGGAGFGGRV